MPSPTGRHPVSSTGTPLLRRAWDWLRASPGPSKERNEEKLRHLADSDRTATRVALVHNPRLPSDLREDLLSKPAVQRVLARSPKILDSEAEFLLCSDDPITLGCLGRNRALKKEFFDQLPLVAVRHDLLTEHYRDHPSLDMILVLAPVWEGSVADLVEHVEALDD